ncbi:aspartate ammonia-lyase [Candidatus Peregrinibacteria bacterium CG22_combo_CG10-13_8_21_14_all_44_10]|nr:MAG: aspartate ammonia-lyase [Candidatus Peregrinibacteria bacterium CG22_combo_CG10-13_8_21_14_all_44_10]PIS04417.1 MAG: aspartate ammonia-lyase [Candidatus Peregrinibacteria bacterium CG10_big_fil_rev_8_21_14_0_10_44_7]PIX79954.1 MAG: aspartate ammonia-lyase [Candidatus Peregrinibacteria bacterium CG_4_10_14_3_um_filter_44_21]PJB88316.1 MAG: aspartate ammonia-lyase [Candidatus Peregrinibacteria bacterium CG_4_9_14_0_8_um_filter_44_15]
MSLVFLIFQRHMTKYRTEKDALGEVSVPKDAYFGSFTSRALDNFQISDMSAPEEFCTALGYVKLAAARANKKLGELGAKEAKAIDKAALEFIDGKFDSEFMLDVFQAGAGTSYNMNANEIIANRANEILGGKKGEYEYVHPNNHVNMAQSSNDVIPTATRIALVMMSKWLTAELEDFIKSLEAKGREFKSIQKVGRTHLQDAVPITLGQEFTAYAQAIKNSLESLKEAISALKQLGIGGTAIGTGVNTHPKFKDTIIAELSELTGEKFSKAPNSITTTHSMQVFSRYSASLRNLAIEIHRIMGDIRLMNAGPRAGVREIKLPKVQPGSSIMPAKLNPSIPECMSMICGQVIGADSVVVFAAQGGQFELNWYTPLIMFNMTMAVRILENGLRMTREKCIDGIEACEAEIKGSFDRSLCTATELVPKLGYHEVTRLVKEAMKSGKGLREVMDDEDRV